jgi:hypothetical protein
MDNSFMLPLRPPVDKRDHKDTLPVRIAQINTQRGSFRNVTEQSLQAEIDCQKEKGDVSDDEGCETKPTEVDATEHLELLYKRRAEIMQSAAYDESFPTGVLCRLTSSQSGSYGSYVCAGFSFASPFKTRASSG